MTNIRIGIIGGGYMGKAHAVAFAAVGGLFDTALRPVLEMVCASTDTSAERYRASFGFNRATSDWRTLVNDPDVDAVVIASPQLTHKDIAIAAFQAGKPVFCEKPLGASLEESREMVAAAKEARRHKHGRLQLHPNPRITICPPTCC
jgi:predicted dehydrogenase